MESLLQLQACISLSISSLSFLVQYQFLTENLSCRHLDMVTATAQVTLSSPICAYNTIGSTNDSLKKFFFYFKSPGHRTLVINLTSQAEERPPLTPQKKLEIPPLYTRVCKLMPVSQSQTL